jgi:sugar diacid utilization regulator/GAF domain-containing protein
VAGVGPAGRDEPDTQGGASVSDAGTVDPSPVAELRVWIAAIDALAAAVNSQAPLEALLDQIARTACQLLGYEYGGVLLADPDRRALRIRGFWGLTEDYVQRVNEDAPLLLAGTGALTDSPSRRAFSDRAPVLVSDITQDSTFGPWGPAALVQGYRAIASVPLRSQAEVIGTLNVYSSAPKALDAAGVDLLQVLANHAGIALETTALLERDRDRLAELTRLNDSLTHQASLLRQAAAIHDRLTGDALRGGGVSSTATALADLTGRAVLIEDVSGRVLASAAHAGVSVRAPSPQERAELGWEELVGSFAGPSRAQGHEPVEQPVPFADLLVTPVRLAAEVVGMIWLVRTPPLHELELRAIEQAKVVLALDALRQRTAAEAQWQLRGDLVTELLTNPHVDSDAMVARAERLGSDLRLPHSVLVLEEAQPARREGPGPDPDALRALQRITVSWARPRPLAAARDNAIVVLVPDSPVHAVGDVAVRLRAAATTASGLPFRAALSEPCPRLDALPSAFRLAHALLVLTPGSAEEAVITLPSAGLVGMLLAEVETSRVGAFAELRLAALRRYDSERGTDLMETLRNYLRQDLNTAATAKALFVHPNTVALRVKRIEQLLEANLNRVDDLTDIRTAVLIDAIRGHIS